MKTRGFTLIEIMVAVSIIAILSSVIGVRTIQVGQQSRDADRQADLRTVQSALELYKNKYGRFPAGCNSGWSGQIGSSYACPGGSSEYIVGLTPEFLPALPKDPKLNGANSGYAYYTNSDGTVFKFIAYRTVESGNVPLDHPFQSCDANPGICDPTSPSGPWSGATPAHCDEFSSIFRTSYGIWGGFPLEPNTGARGEELLESVICRMP